MQRPGRNNQGVTTRSDCCSAATPPGRLTPLASQGAPRGTHLRRSPPGGDCSTVLIRRLSHTTVFRSPARGPIVLCVAGYLVVDPVSTATVSRSSAATRATSVQVQSSCFWTKRSLREAARTSAGRNRRVRALTFVHTSACNGSSVGGELALRPERSAQAQMPPTARHAPRGGRRGLLVLTAGPVPYYCGVTYTALDRVGIHCESCSAVGAAPGWTRACGPCDRLEA